MRGMLNGNYMTRILPVLSPRVRHFASSDILVTPSGLIHLNYLSVYIFMLICHVEISVSKNIMEKMRHKCQLTKHTEVTLVVTTSA